MNRNIPDYWLYIGDDELIDLESDFPCITPKEDRDDRTIDDATSHGAAESGTDDSK